MKVSTTNRFSNHLILKEIGGHGQKLLNESRALIIGLGGLGCPVLQYAAGSGIGTIGLIDNDFAVIGSVLDVEIRNRTMKCKIVKPPFYKNGSLLS